jgi:hypothetical protein
MTSLIAATVRASRWTLNVTGTRIALMARMRKNVKNLRAINQPTFYVKQATVASQCLSFATETTTVWTILTKQTVLPWNVRIIAFHAETALAFHLHGFATATWIALQDQMNRIAQTFPVDQQTSANVPTGIASSVHYFVMEQTTVLMAQTNETAIHVMNPSSAAPEDTAFPPSLCATAWTTVEQGTHGMNSGVE